MNLNPRQFVQPMLGNMREDYPLMPIQGTVKGDPVQPLYRTMTLPSLPDAGSDEDLVSGYLDAASRGGGDYPRKGSGFLGLHWSHNRVEADSGDEDRVSVAWEVDHPGHDSVMDWENASDLPIMERTIVDKDYKTAAFPEVPLRPGTDVNLRAMHLQDPWSGDWRRIGFNDRRRA